MVLTATAPPDLLEMLKSILIDPAVYKASVDRPNITFTARKSKFGGKIPKAVMDGKTSAGKTILLLTYHKSNTQSVVVTHTVHVNMCVVVSCSGPLINNLQRATSTLWSLVAKILILCFCYRCLLAATCWGGSSRNWQCHNYHICWLQKVCYRPCYIFQPAYWNQDSCINWRRHYQGWQKVCPDELVC